MKYRFARIGSILAIAMAFGMPVHAQDVSAPTAGVSQHVEMQGLATDISTLQAKVTSATTRLFKIKDCHSRGFLFRTLSDGTEGCQAVVPCQTPWGTILGVGESALAYQAATVPYGSNCASENRTCDQSAGTLTGSFQYQTCTQGAAPTIPCNLPWGGQISNGQSVTAYAASSVAYNSSCAAETRSCSNGTLTGSYQYASCSVQQWYDSCITYCAWATMYNWGSCDGMPGYMCDGPRPGATCNYYAPGNAWNCY